MKLLLKIDISRCVLHILDCETKPVLGVRLFCMISQQKSDREKINLRYGTPYQIYSMMKCYHLLMPKEEREKFDKLMWRLKDEKY